MKTLPESHGEGAAHLDRTTCEEDHLAAIRHRLNAAEGYLTLALPKDAERELDCIEAPTSLAADVEAAMLKAVCMQHGPRNAVERATSLIARGIINECILATAAIEANNVGMPELALRLLDDHLPEAWKTPEVSHTHACAYSQLGRHQLALRYNLQTIRGYNDSAAMALDAHLSPTWHHFAQAVPDVEDARIIAGPEFAAMTAAVRTDQALRGFCWFTAQLLIPADIRAFMVRTRNLYAVLPWTAPESIVGRYRAWLANHRGRIATCPGWVPRCWAPS